MSEEITKTDSPVEIHRTQNGYMAICPVGQMSNGYRLFEESLSFETFDSLIAWLSNHYSRPTKTSQPEKQDN